MTSTHLGEISLALAGTSFVLKPSFATLMALEAATGTGLITLARKFASGEFTLAELAALLKAGIEGAGGQAPDNLGELVASEGVANVAAVLSRFLTQALAGEVPKA